MKKIKENYKYLLRLYDQVNDYLSDDSRDDNFPEVIVSFCIVSERLLKIKLHQENPILVFENCKIKEKDVLISIVKNEENNIGTIKINEVLDRYKLMFDNEFTDYEMQALVDIYRTRNQFMHSYKSDNLFITDEDNVVKKMSTIWEKISKLATSMFGDEIIKSKKPKKKYTENELEKRLEEEVKKKIKSDNYSAPLNSLSLRSVSLNPWGEEKCPRCGSYGFSLENNNHEGLLTSYDRIKISSTSPWVYSGGNFSDLYKCNNCNLELTQKEFEIAKKINRDK